MPIMKNPEKILELTEVNKFYGDSCSECSLLLTDENRNTCPTCGTVHAVQNVSLSLHRGEILGIIGESGSGKSTLLKMMVFDELCSSGSFQFHRSDQILETSGLNAAQRRHIRNNHYGIVYQNPHLGLNFKISAGGNIAERLLMGGTRSYEVIRSRSSNLLSRAEVPVNRMDELPSSFSGGMQQRVQIAKALATNPEILFLDEVTTGLDLSVQARILDMILELQQVLGISMIVVTHDLGVVRLLASRTMVMKYGKVIESGLTDQILEDPQHRYTQQLVSSSL